MRVRRVTRAKSSNKPAVYVVWLYFINKRVRAASPLFAGTQDSMQISHLKPNESAIASF